MTPQEIEKLFEGAPKWANVILEHECINGRQCWAESFNHLAKAKNTSSGSEFPLDSSMWRIISERPSPSWSGEGLPPVGVECEYQRNDVSYKQAWVAVTARYIGESITVLKHSASGSEFTEMTASCVFRSIRTPEQIAADERASALHMAICDVEEKVAKWNTTIDCTAAIKATIDAMISLGYRKT